MPEGEPESIGPVARKTALARTATGSVWWRAAESQWSMVKNDQPRAKRRESEEKLVRPDNPRSLLIEPPECSSKDPLDETPQSEEA
jgi:hypothetical protein